MGFRVCMTEEEFRKYLADVKARTTKNFNIQQQDEIFVHLASCLRCIRLKNKVWDEIYNKK